MAYNWGRIDKYTFISLMLVYFYDVFSSVALLLEKCMSGLYLLHEVTAASSEGLSTFADAMGSYEALGNKLTEIDALAGKL